MYELYVNTGSVDIRPLNGFQFTSCVMPTATRCARG